MFDQWPFMGGKYLDKGFMLMLIFILYTPPEQYFNGTVPFNEHTSIF